MRAPRQKISNTMSIRTKTIPLKCLGIILFSSIYLSEFVGIVNAQDKKSSKTIETVQSLQPKMRAASDAYQELIGLLFDSQKFSDPQNTKRIKDHLEQLQNNFHSADKKFSVLSEDPTASANLSALSAAIEDAAKRFNEGNFDYARWRLKTINLNCVTCHATNQSQLYSRQAEAPAKAPKHEQADFYLATRRFDKAKQLFAELLVAKSAADEPIADNEERADKIERLRALKGWLWVVVRHEVSIANNSDARVAAAKSATKKLRELVSKGGFTEETRLIVEQWGNDLEVIESIAVSERWEKEDLTDSSTFSSFAAEPRNFVKVLALMQRLSDKLAILTPDKKAQSSAPLQKSDKGQENGVVVNTVLNTERAQIMLKLGLLTGQSYDLTWDNLPDAYLKGCISQAPKSPVARLCLEALKDFLEREFMGPGGSQLPSDIKANLDALRQSVQ